MRYCVTRLDDGKLTDLTSPDKETMEPILNNDGFYLADDDQMPTEPGKTTEIKWIIIIIVICAVAAVVIVILAIGKVIHRKR